MKSEYRKSKGGDRTPAPTPTDAPAQPAQEPLDIPQIVAEIEQQTTRMHQLSEEHAEMQRQFKLDTEGKRHGERPISRLSLDELEHKVVDLARHDRHSCEHDLAHLQYELTLLEVIPIRDRNCDFDLPADAVYCDTIS
jgi:hypothetical protein